MIRDHDPQTEAALEQQRAECFARYQHVGPRVMSTLDLRAAAQHAQVIGDVAAERELSGEIDYRERIGR